VYKHILIATDGSTLATKALEHGLGLAKRAGYGCNSNRTVVAARNGERGARKSVVRSDPAIRGPGGCYGETHS
jgi:nucleotide-binding universal stress UspA family protein